MDNKQQHTIKYLNQTIGKKTGFSIPEDYFNDVEETILTAKSTEVLPTENAFKVPDNYFDSLENNISHQLKSTNKKPVITLQKRLLKYMLLATAAAILLFIGINRFNVNTFSFDDVTLTDLEFLHENGYTTIYTDELAITLNSDDFYDDILPSVNDESLEDYFNTIDNTTILNEIE